RRRHGRRGRIRQADAAEVDGAAVAAGRLVRARAELVAAGGDIDRIPVRNVFCPMIYAPVTARARGRWNGHPVAFRKTYANTCVLNARTGSVFALDG
ncbi:SSI family serine proteinase inhibitor, partial [Streptomyces sp. NPDC004561]